MAEIQLSGVSMVYPNGTQALKQVDLTVSDHEFIVLLGPSGCGKSTLLRLIAGLEKPTEGTLRFDGEDVSTLEPMKRNVAMVFQSFALYPHLTVYKNMAFPLKSMKLPQEEIKRRVEAAAKILDIDYLLNRRPRVLSGGQRQRVALGRAMVREPVVFLLDEPLSNLDAKMRTELRDQIIRLHERLKTTFVYVTHDQAEAMQMGDRLAIMDMGRIVQTGTPQEIYDHPNSVYVAGFVGAPKINFFASHLRRGETGWSIRLLGKTLELPAQRLPLDTAGAEDGTGSVTVTLADGRRYRVEPYLLRQQADTYYLLLFRDVNDYLNFVEETDRNRVVLAYIVLDNLQELTQFVRANYRATANIIEETLTGWVASMHGMIREYDRDKYLALFSEEMLDRCVQDNFSILGKIMNIRVGDNTFPLSVSMGIADIDGSMEERDRAANAALDMALQRGGNQVALQRRGVTGLTYYGGTHKTLEGNTSISSRVSVHLLERRLAGCRNVLVMGHSNPDFDAIGAAVGASRLCRSILDAQGRTDVPVNIVTDKTCDTFRICAGHLAPLGLYGHIFVDAATARQLVCTETVLILVDVNNPVIFEAPGLYTCIPAVDGIHSIAVIDHHRLVGFRQLGQRDTCTA